MEIKSLNLTKLFEKIRLNKKLLIIVAAAVAGILLILMSELPSRSAEKAENAAPTQVEDSSYAEEVESRLSEIIASINGAGKTKVMVTLESSTEQVYAKNEKEQYESESLVDALDSAYSAEREYVLIETDSKGEGGLIIKMIQPKIRGVAVVCEGGGSDVVRREIAQTVTAVLDISASRVYITEMNS